jgi:hypothetical protein
MPHRAYASEKNKDNDPVEECLADKNPGVFLRPYRPFRFWMHRVNREAYAHRRIKFVCLVPDSSLRLVRLPGPYAVPDSLRMYIGKVALPQKTRRIFLLLGRLAGGRSPHRASAQCFCLLRVNAYSGVTFSKFENSRPEANASREVGERQHPGTIPRGTDFVGTTFRSLPEMSERRSYHRDFWLP